MTVVELYDKTSPSKANPSESTADLPRHVRFKHAQDEIKGIDRRLDTNEYNRRQRDIWRKWDIQGGEG